MLQTSMPPKIEQEIEVRPSFVIQILRWGVQFALMAALLIGALAYMSRSMEQTSEPVSKGFQRTPITVTAATVELTDNRPTFISYGRVVAANQIEIKSAVSGRVLWAAPDLQVGNIVAEGAEIIHIDDFAYRSSVSEVMAEITQTKAALSEARLRLDSEQAQLKGAEAQLKIARTDLTRAEQLVAQGAATRKQIDDREVIVSQRQLTVQQRKNNIEIEGARQEQQLASLAALELRLERAERALKDTVIKSPITGRVGLIAVETGQEITTQSILSRLDRTDSLDVEFTLTDAQFGRLLEDDQSLIGRSVRIKWVVGEKEVNFPAIIKRLGAEINTDFGGVQVFASLNDPDAIQILRPGAFVEIEVPDRNYKNSVLIPETSIYDGGIVYRISEKGRLIEMPVSVVAYSGGNAIIASGLENGQHILTTRLSRITGRSVQILGKADKNKDVGAAPTQDLVERIKKENQITQKQWQSKSDEERQALIERARKKRDQ